MFAKPFLTLLLGAALSGSALAQGRPVTLDDLMAFRSIDKPSLSDNGQVLAFSAQPDRGDATGVVRFTDSDRKLTVARGTEPVLTPDGRYVAFWQLAPLLERENAKKGDEPKKALVVVDSQSGAQSRFEDVVGFALSDSGGRLALLLEQQKDDADKDKQDGQDDKAKQDEPARELKIVTLGSGAQERVANVNAFAFQPDSQVLFYAQPARDEQPGRLWRHDGKAKQLAEAKGQRYEQLTFSEDGRRLALLGGTAEQDEAERAYQVLLFDGKLKTLKLPKDGWFVPHHNELKFSKDGRRLFVGRKPLADKPAEPDSAFETDADLTDLTKLQARRKLRVWHGDDQRIKPNEAKAFEKEQKRFYYGVFHLNNGRFVQLADRTVPDLELGEQSGYLLGSSQQPYLREMTWAGFYRDYYAINLSTGEKHLIVRRQSESDAPSISPQGHYAVFYRGGQVHMHDVRRGRTQTLTAGLPISFANEDHDYPSETPGYGAGPWLADESAVLFYDKFDIWRLGSNGSAENLTGGEGRKAHIQYRVISQDPDSPHVRPGQPLLLSGYHDDEKHKGLYRLVLGRAGIKPLKVSAHQYNFVAKARDADTLIYTREAFDEFPDLWVTSDFSDARRLTEVNPVTRELAWGEPELVKWRNLDGRKLQGILIKPAGYQEGQRYPVLVYYYRFFTPRLHQFNEFKVNHRPNFAWYTSNGYAVFLPDIRFDVGTPGDSATSALVPGVQKLIDMGIADEKAIGLHGHSWSGYQTAFAITQTDLFAAAVAGAPVSNMTSAYSGIRWGTGLARQFQYEQGQSRIGASLYEAPELYIENSPVFYADRINTPLLIQFGDQDEAVPWQQGIELYLALRRLNKPVVMLQYEGEPHHLKQYPNKVDYTLKMKAFFDHHLKGAPAPAWWSQGEAFRPGKKKD
ncbi:prolyl oligopeptidase family serine peptidase [Gallaecimonas sp. GXIMD4217]|uniref:S9 family peptidase n=1 Tax=Gallaecimonas sp. GXIMD4217 TaxID=3131927 RepID=UPI00311B40AD